MSDEAIKAQMQEWLSAAAEQRARARNVLPPSGAPPARVAEALVTVRACLDRVEEIWVSALSLRSAARRRSRDLAGEETDAWDTQSAAYRRTAVGDRYQSGRQHEADVNLAIFQQRKDARAVARIAELADDTVRQIEVMYRGMDGSRQDLNARLRHLQWESQMER